MLRKGPSERDVPILVPPSSTVQGQVRIFFVYRCQSSLGASVSFLLLWNNGIKCQDFAVVIDSAQLRGNATCQAPVIH